MPLSYRLEIRPRRQHPAIQVNSRKQVTVLLPVGFSSTEADALVRKKADWILKQLRKPSLPPKRFVSGERFFLGGTGYRLRVVEESNGRANVWIDDANLIVSTSGPPSPDSVRSTLIQWFRIHAEKRLYERMSHYQSLTGIDVRQIKIGEYKSRWGFCREDGVIAFNWRIVQAPLGVIDYLVVHELAHRHHPHHQPSFWRMVDAILPGYAVHRQWLRQHGAELNW